MRIPHYTKVYQLGHRWITTLLDGHIIIEEKIDGSQFSFRVKDGKPECCSHNQDKTLDNTTNDMFHPAVLTVLDLFTQNKLQEGLTYRGEFLNKPCHNVLKYNRVPIKNIILFDIDMGVENYTPHKSMWADGLGLEIVPLLWEGEGKDFTLDLCKELLERESILGGTKIEGIVIKNYDKFGPDGKIMAGKFVSEKFKETAQNKLKNILSGTQAIILRLKTEARWQKAIQHLTESNLLQNEPADIGPLVKEIKKDVLEECKDQIKDWLFDHYWKDIRNGIVRGFPEYYKQKLLEKQLNV